VPQSATAAAAALYVTDRAGPRLSPRPRDLDLRWTAIRNLSLPSDGLHLRNDMDYYSFTDQKRWKAELAWLAHL